MIVFASILVMLAAAVVCSPQRAGYGYLIPRYSHWQGPPSVSRLSTQ